MCQFNIPLLSCQNLRRNDKCINQLQVCMRPVLNNFLQRLVNQATNTKGVLVWPMFPYAVFFRYC